MLLYRGPCSLEPREVDSSVLMRSLDLYEQSRVHSINHSGSSGGVLNRGTSQFMFQGFSRAGPAVAQLMFLLIHCFGQIDPPVLSGVPRGGECL